MLKLKKVFAGAAALAVASIGVTSFVSSSDAATPGICPLSGVVSAEAPTFSDVDGFENDTVTIPQSDCINYTINGWDTPAGTYNLSNLTMYEKTDTSNDWLVATATVQAESKADHWQLSGIYLWRQGFIGVYDPNNMVKQISIGLPPTMPAVRIPVAPTFTDAQGLNEATVTIPKQDGVTYTIKGDKKTEVVAAGTYKVVNFANIRGTRATLTVTATSSDKKHVVISGTSTWTQEVYAALTSGTTSPTTTPTPPTADPVSQSITDGVYVITSALNNNKALDVNEASKKAGANIQLWDRNNGNAQRFQVTHLGGNQYSIINVHSGKALDIDGNSKQAGANVHQWTWSGSNNQRFIITPAKNGGYNIKAVSSGLFLDVYGSRTANGTNVIQWSGNGSNANQRWNFSAYTASPALKEVTAPDPKADIQCRVLIPNVEGVDYYRDGKKLAPGTNIFEFNEIKPITVKAQNGYKLTNPDAHWEAFYCIGEPVMVTPTTPAPTPSPSQSVSTPKKVTFVAPTFDQKNNKYTIPNVEGVQYSVDGKNVAAGTYDVTGWDSNGNATVSVTAKAKAGYVNENGYSAYTWKASFIRTAAAKAPTFNVTGKQDTDTFTIPSTTGVEYYANGTKVAAGTHKVKDYATYSVTSTIGTAKVSSATLTVEARGTNGYQVTGTYKWTQQFMSSSDSSVVIIGGDSSQQLIQVTPQAPTFTAGWSFWFIKVPSKYTIPSMTGVDYYVNGQKVNAGTYQVPSGSSVTIKAVPQKGYTFPYNTVTINQWSYYSSF